MLLCRYYFWLHTIKIKRFRQTYTRPTKVTLQIFSHVSYVGGGSDVSDHCSDFFLKKAHAFSRGYETAHSPSFFFTSEKLTTTTTDDHDHVHHRHITSKKAVHNNNNNRPSSQYINKQSSAI